MIDSSLIYKGQKLKYALTLRCSGFDQDTDEWTVVLKRGSAEIALEKSDCVKDDEGQWYITFDTSLLGAGYVKITVTAFVVDYDFPEGIREEIYQDTLCNIKNL